MFSLIKKHATSLIVLLVVIVGFVVYNFFFVGDSDENIVVETMDVSDPGSDLVALLLKLRGLDLDNAIFNSPEFKGFIDFGRELEPEGVGRANPFAPLGQ